MRKSNQLTYNSASMGKTLFRLLAVAILAVSVPVQGVAAVTAGVCMALGHHDAAMHDGDVHDGDGAPFHKHGDHGSTEGKGSKGAHCPPCVSCCAAAAITSFSPLALPERPAVKAVFTLPPLFSGTTPESLDRPPLAL